MDQVADQKLPFARSFKELAVYQKARTLSRTVFKITKRFPKEEAYSLTDQWRRAARSIGAQISEPWAKRRYPAHFASKPSDADGEQLETQHVRNLALEVGRMLGDMIQNAESFRGDDYILKETTRNYFVNLTSTDSELNTEY